MTSQAHSGVALLECTWWKHSEVSLRPLLHSMCHVVDDVPLTFHYEMVNSGAALREAIPRVIRMRQVKYLYLASHGSAAHLDCFNGDSVAIGELAAMLEEPLRESGTSLQGIYLSACGLGSVDNLTAILAATPKIAWIAGYSKDVDWLGSALLDMQFLYHLVGSDAVSAGDRVKKAAAELKKWAAGACAEFGFSVLQRADRRSPRNLMDVA